MDQNLVAALAAKGKPATQDYDGLVVLEAESYEKILEIFDDEDYKRLAVPEEGEFVDRSATRLVPAGFATIF